MSTKTDEIQQAINTFDIELARNLLRDELKNNPDADIYYLSSQVALDDTQRRHFLNQALELDPFHQDAYNALEALSQTGAPRPTQQQANSFNTYIQSDSKYWNGRRLAASSKRFVAVLIDIGILIFIGTIANWIITLLVPPPSRSNYSTIPDYIHAVDMWNLFAYIIGVILNATYYITTLTYMKGQTIGKKL